MSNTKVKILMALVVWLSILSIVVFWWKNYYAPKQVEVQQKQAKELEEQQRELIIKKTSSSSRFKYNLNFCADSFSGYSIFRSSSFKEEAAKFEIKMNIIDDNADYISRIKKLANGEIDMAVFTIDSLIRASSEIKDMPASIVAIVDETKGADAFVASKIKFPNTDSLNTKELKIVCVKDSPSEMLARVVGSNLNNFSDDVFEFKNNMDDVYKEYQITKPNDPKVFVLREPYVSKVLDNPDYHSLVNSGKYIVDVIVARRSLIVQNQPLVQNVVKSYLSSLYKEKENMHSLVASDSNLYINSINEDQAKKLVSKIWWKNTQENFAHFGFINGNVKHIDELCSDLMAVLTKTNSIQFDPSNGNTNNWYYDGIVKSLFDSSWHPGFATVSESGETIRQEISLKSLTEDEWKKLVPVASFQAPKLVFARGSSKLSDSNSAILDKLAQSLNNLPHCYMIVCGNHMLGGNEQANKKLAEERVQSTIKYLSEKGIDKSRMNSVISSSNGSSTVSFTLGEFPY